MGLEAIDDLRVVAGWVGFVELTPTTIGGPLVTGGNKFNFAAERDNLTWSLFYSRDGKTTRGNRKVSL